MKDSRSASQILFGLLPEQTLDARGGVWKVRSWNTQSVHDVDVEELRRELARCAAPWEREGRDEGFVAALRQGRPVRVETLDRQDGVRVDPFPRTWRCKRCGQTAANRRLPTLYDIVKRFLDRPDKFFHELQLFRRRVAQVREIEPLQPAQRFGNRITRK